MDILFVVDRVDLRGGVSRSLLELFDLLPPEGATYSLAVTSGHIDGGIPAHISVLPREREIIHRGFVASLRAARGPLRKCRLIVSRFAFILTKDRGAFLRELTSQSAPLGKFDTVIAYGMLDSICVSLAITRSQANRRVLWTHIDADIYSADALKGMDRTYDSYDEIVCVAEGPRRSMARRFSQLEPKLRVVQNYVNPERVLRGASEFTPQVTRFTMCTVGRIAAQKGIDTLVSTAAQLAESGLDFDWWVVGAAVDSKYELRVRSQISAQGLESRVHLLGHQANPYPWMAACDVYVQPSRHEGNPLTLREAQLLGRYRVATDFSAAHEAIRDGVDGRVVPHSPEALATTILELSRAPDALRYPSSDDARTDAARKLVKTVLG